MDDLVTEFVAETREGLEALDSELVRFEQNPDDPDILGNVFRLIHTIKGTCGFLGLVRLQNVAHAAENVLGAFRDGSLDVRPEAVSAVLETVDLIRGLIDRLARDGVETAGDDSALIGRLEAVFHVAKAPQQTGAADEGALALDKRLGGEATLDAAVETVLSRAAHSAVLKDFFVGSNPDHLQAVLRDGFFAAARGQGDAASIVAALHGVTGRTADAEIFNAMLDATSVALSELDIPASAIDALRACLALPAAQIEVTISASAESTSVTTASVDPEPVAAQTIRVSIDALENLMTVVSELVLLRNQLIQTLRTQPESPFAAPLHRLSQVTSELQEGVMTTRMQPISGAWAKLPRLVRDLARDLGKKIDLVTVGQETELDRQVLELIKDPLTHMIRNAADHGLETPEERMAQGKSPVGRITLQARHEGGAIVIEISDDGRGLAAAKLRAKAVANGIATQAQADAMSDADARQIIFMAGFSTAAQVTSVSGRGVGMDVVRTNIEKIGGIIELQSVEGKGTQFTIRIPLTLTIVSALIVESCGVRFAMPQSSVVELVSASNASGKLIEYVGDAAVLRLRDRLLPLVSLETMLGLPPKEDRRPESCIVVARVGAFTFGVIVDRVFDTEEIVVKPVASVLRHLKLYSGATILGDGSVIMILDFKGISAETGAAHATGSIIADAAAAETAAEPLTALLLFKTRHGAIKAAKLSNVARIEDVQADQFEHVDGRTVLQYRGRLMPVVGDDGRPAKPPPAGEQCPLLVFTREDQSIGLLAASIVDIVETRIVADLSPGEGGGALGSLIVGDRATELIDIEFYWRAALGHETQSQRIPTARPATGRKLLVVDQSSFSRILLTPLLTRAGYDVTIAPDPAAALALHDAGERFELIMADTTPGAENARALAAAFVKATHWRETPLVALALQSGAPAEQLGQELVDTLSNASPLRGAA